MTITLEQEVLDALTPTEGDMVDIIVDGIDQGLAGGRSYVEAVRIVLDATIEHSQEVGWSRDDTARIGSYVLTIARGHRAALIHAGRL